MVDSIKYKCTINSKNARNYNINTFCSKYLKLKVSERYFMDRTINLKSRTE